MLKNFQDLVNISLPSLLPENYTYVEIKKDDIVNPKKGNRSTEFDFSVEIENENKPEDRTIVSLWLNITHPDNRSDGRLAKYKRIVHPYDYINNRKTVSWKKIQPFLNDKCVGNVSFCIDYDEGKGPKSIKSSDIIAIINNPAIVDIQNATVNPKKENCLRRFTYKVYVSDPDGDPVNITLYLVDPDKKSIINKEEIESGEMTEKVKNGFFERGYKFPLKSYEDTNVTLKYYFTYDDGIYEAGKLNKSRTRDKEDPHIYPLPKLVVIKNTYIKDVKDKYFWWEELVFEMKVNNPSPEIINITAFYKINNETKSEKVKVEPGTFTPSSPQFKPFSILNTGKNVSIILGFEDQYGNVLSTTTRQIEINPKISPYRFPDVVVSGVVIIFLSFFLPIFFIKDRR